jgi:hypothetical protein
MTWRADGQSIVGPTDSGAALLPAWMIVHSSLV